MAVEKQNLAVGMPNLAVGTLNLAVGSQMGLGGRVDLGGWVGSGDSSRFYCDKFLHTHVHTYTHI